MTTCTSDKDFKCRRPDGKILSSPPQHSLRAQKVVISSQAVCSAGSSTDLEVAPEAPEKVKIDVSNNCVDTVFRSQEALLAAEASQENRTKARILFLSESNVCRSVLAEAAFNKLIEEHGLSEVVECQSKGTRDYCVGEGPDAAAAAVALRLGLPLQEGQLGRHFDHIQDILEFDLLLAVDKFTLADAMREISVYDTVNSSRNFSSRVRHLGEYNTDRADKELDIDDPLYGGAGGLQAEDDVFDAAIKLEKCCEGLIAALVKVKSQASETPGSFRECLIEYRSNLGDVDWLVPPMLRDR